MTLVLFNIRYIDYPIRLLAKRDFGHRQGRLQGEADCLRFVPAENFTTTKSDIPKFVFQTFSSFIKIGCFSIIIGLCGSVKNATSIVSS